MNNENMTIHFKVKDFNAWQTSYNGNEKICTAAGITKSKECSAAPTTPMMCCSSRMLPTYRRARTWYGSSEMKAVLEKSGVVGSPSIRSAAAA